MATGTAGMTITSGKTTAPATTPCTAPKTSFSIATSATGSGARTRSSISLVAPSSMDSGSATAEIPWNTIPTATSPGTTTVA